MVSSSMLRFAARLSGWAALILVAGVWACGPSGSYVWGRDYRALPPVGPGELIQPGDKVSVRVFGQDPMSIQGQVRPNGKLAVPLLGEFPMAGRAPEVVAEDLKQRLTPFVAAPQVIVVIDEFKLRVTAFGEVRRNGRLALEPPATLLQGLAEAGGLTEFADDSAIFVLRGNHRIRFTYEELATGEPAARTFLLVNGDVIVVE